VSQEEHQLYWWEWGAAKEDCELMRPAVASPAHESKLYYEFSRLYDHLFRPVFSSRIAKVIGSLEIPPGARVLEIGVGTGLSLAAYPFHCQVTGIDLAPEMLEWARRKAIINGWRHISLMQMDAMELCLPDDSFDYVMGFHVASVVPDPVRMMREASRVCRPGGKLVLINHFRTERKALGALVDIVDPLTRRLGWRSTLRLNDVLDGVPVAVERKFKTSPYSLFTVVIATNTKAGTSSVAAAAL